MHESPVRGEDRQISHVHIWNAPLLRVESAFGSTTFVKAEQLAKAWVLIDVQVSAMITLCSAVQLAKHWREMSVTESGISTLSKAAQP